MTTIRYAGNALTEQAAPFMAALADPHGTEEEWVSAAIGLSELVNRISKLPPESPQMQALRAWDNLAHPAGSDPRDYLVESGLWRSELLPLGVSTDEAILDGTWQ